MLEKQWDFRLIRSTVSQVPSGNLQMNGLKENVLTEQGLNPDDKHLRKVLQLTQAIHGLSAATRAAYRWLCYYTG